MLLSRSSTASWHLEFKLRAHKALGQMAVRDVSDELRETLVLPVGSGLLVLG